MSQVAATGLTADRRNAYQQAVQRSLDWGQQLLGGSAVFGNPSAVSLGLYKGLLAFNAVNDVDMVPRLLQAIRDKAFKDGDFHAQCPKTPLALVNNYRNAWFALGCHTVGAQELCEATLNRFEQHMHSKWDAVPNRDDVKPAMRLYDLGTNASAAQALLVVGHLKSAKSVASFMRNLILTQAADVQQVSLAKSPLGLVWKMGSRFLPRQARGLFLLDVGAAQQTYWPLGLALRVFAQMFQATGQAQWLQPTQRIRQWLVRSHADMPTCITSAKLGLGAAQMYAVTHDAYWSDLAVAVLDHFVASQSPDGSWLRPEYGSMDAQPLPMTLDTSLERMYYLHSIPQTLLATDEGK